MATKSPTGTAGSFDCTTEYALHSSLRAQDYKNVLDLSEFRMRRYADSVTDQQQQRVLLQLIEEFLDGDIAVAWKRGRLSYIRVTRGA